MSSETVSDEERADALIKAIADANSATLEARDLVLDAFDAIRSEVRYDMANGQLGSVIGILLSAGMDLEEIDAHIAKMVAVMRSHPEAFAEAAGAAFREMTGKGPSKQ